MIDDTVAGLTPRGRATYARIVGAAADLVYTRGLHNTAATDVRKAAAVSGSQMSHYFSDKQAIVRSVIAQRRNEVVAFHTSGELANLDSLDSLQKWADVHVQRLLENDYYKGGCTFGSLVGELVPPDDDIRGALSEVYDEWIALFRTALTSMRKRGQLRADADPVHLARVLVAAHQGGSLVTQITRSISPLRDALNAAVDYVSSFATQPVTGRKHGRKTPSRRIR